MLEHTMYILYTIYYILYTIYYILYTMLCALHHIIRSRSYQFGLTCQSCDRLITTGMSGAVVPLLQTGEIEALQLLTELGMRSLEMPAPGENAIWAGGIVNPPHEFS